MALQLMLFTLLRKMSWTIWISTNDQQLYYLEEGSFQKPKKPLTFGRNEVIGIGSDHFGNILITHQRGLMVYDVATEETIDYHHFYQEASFSPALNAVATDMGRQSMAWRNKAVALLHSFLW